MCSALTKRPTFLITHLPFRQLCRKGLHSCEPMYLLPSPAVGEFSLGYLGRLAHLNFATSAYTFSRDLTKFFGFKANAGVRLKVLARAAGLSVPDFLSAHTIAPAIVCGKDVSQGLVGGHITYLCPDQRNPMQLPEESAFYCEVCLTEQHMKSGFGYWHRVHQLPGVYWCPWHKVPLVQCERRYVYEKQPSWDFPVRDESPLVRNDIDHPVLNRYNEVIMDFLKGPGAIDELKLLFLLTDVARQKGINTGMWASDEPFLSDIIFDIIPHWWLQDIVDVSQKVAGRFFGDIDDAVFTARVGSRVYALATAILLDGDSWDISSTRVGGDKNSVSGSR